MQVHFSTKDLKNDREKLVVTGWNVKEWEKNSGVEFK